jgi:uncharacterized membrane protein YfhO
VLEELPDITLTEETENPEYEIEDQVFETNRISLKVQTNAPGFLVLSEIYNPDWQVHIDGKKTKIYCADYILRAVPIGRGIHQVEFFYNPLSFRVGRIITVCTLVFTVCLLFLL